MQVRAHIGINQMHVWVSIGHHKPTLDAPKHVPFGKSLSANLAAAQKTGPRFPDPALAAPARSAEIGDAGQGWPRNVLSSKNYLFSSVLLIQIATDGYHNAKPPAKSFP